jgi:hypothetical protein
VGQDTATLLGIFLGSERGLPDKLSPQLKAQLLYEYCLASDKKVSESVHCLFIIAEHYSTENPSELEKPEVINGIPPFFASLSKKEKAIFCYNQVIEALSLEARPVTVESLLATKRLDPNDPWSSFAGNFVRRVTIYVSLSLVVMFGLWYSNVFSTTSGIGIESQWVAFGCLGALVHLLNHALTTTRLQTFELSETRKIWPRLMLGGMFGFVVPWILTLVGPLNETNVPAGAVAAFFGGYSVRFSTGLLERLLSALFPETKPKA